MMTAPPADMPERFRKCWNPMVKYSQSEIREFYEWPRKSKATLLRVLERNYYCGKELDLSKPKAIRYYHNSSKLWPKYNKVISFALEQYLHEMTEDELNLVTYFHPNLIKFIHKPSEAIQTKCFRWFDMNKRGLVRWGKDNGRDVTKQIAGIDECLACISDEIRDMHYLIHA